MLTSLLLHAPSLSIIHRRWHLLLLLLWSIWIALVVWILHWRLTHRRIVWLGHLAALLRWIIGVSALRIIAALLVLAGLAAVGFYIIN